MVHKFTSMYWHRVGKGPHSRVGMGRGGGAWVDFAKSPCSFFGVSTWPFFQPSRTLSTYTFFHKNAPKLGDSAVPTAYDGHLIFKRVSSYFYFNFEKVHHRAAPRGPHLPVVLPVAYPGTGNGFPPSNSLLWWNPLLKLWIITYEYSG